MMPLMRSADDVADAEQFAGHLAGNAGGVAEEAERNADGAAQDVHAFGEELVSEGDAEADEDGRAATVPPFSPEMSTAAQAVPSG